LYREAIRLLLDIQFAGPSRASIPIEGFSLAFDYEKLNWEVNFTIEHFYEIHLKRDFDPCDRQTLTKGFDLICNTLANEPRVFTHRDYHSRNIMVIPNESDGTERFSAIDFQDARMGCPQYDLASLLRDSYYQLDEFRIARLLDYYMDEYEKRAHVKLDRPHFIKIFDWMSIQRNFKAIGSFASFLNLRGNPAYLKYVGNTFENIRRALLKYPELHRLKEVLYHYYYF
jgi:aminoglycoside/choline kinase family phosphotransferase